MDTQTSDMIFKGVRSKKQIMFVMLYCNPESPSYDNGTQSYMKAYNTDNTNVSAVESHTILNKPHVIKAIQRYRDYLHEIVGFELDWLDTHLRNLHNRVQGTNDKTELAVLKTIGERIGAFKDQTESKDGMFIPLTADEEQLANSVIKSIMDKKKREQIKKISEDIGKDMPQVDLN